MKTYEQEYVWNDFTRNDGYSFKSMALITENCSSNSLLRHIGTSTTTQAVYRIYPIEPSTDDGRSDGIIHWNV